MIALAIGVVVSGAAIIWAVCKAASDADIIAQQFFTHDKPGLTDSVSGGNRAG